MPRKGLFLDWGRMADYDIEIKLHVPPDRTRRALLIKVARDRIAAAGAVPPISFEALQRLGEAVLLASGDNADELAFVMLMCNNELWRPFFEATPPHRRLLLLPQCLKNSGSCNAIIDEMGLICAACDRCQLNAFIEKSENLGYETLIAEGSTAAMKLVEEGAVDAILGVSCMEVLKKSFRHTVSSAIPAMAIPLLNNGCKDTEVDQEWLFQEITSFAENRHMQPLSVSVMNAYIKRLFSEIFLSSQIGMVANQTHTGTLAVKSILQGGKRMRPLLTYLAYMAYADRFDQHIADQLMLIVECFHKASIIHDDIEDQDEYRYDMKTVHHENGIPIAVNLGDYLIGQGYRKLSAIPLPEKQKLLLFELFSSLHVESTLGQGEELIAVDRQTVYDTIKTMHIFKQKTGSAIQVSLLSGAIAADAPEGDQKVLADLSNLFGLAYQIRDDLNEFMGLAVDQKTASFPFLKSLLVEKHHTIPQKDQKWKELIVEYEIEHLAQEVQSSTLTELVSAINTLSSHKLRLALLNLVNRIFKVS